jgi:hypothetical protein
VLEEVGNAGDARSFVGATHMGHPPPGHAWVIVALQQEDFHTV